jgi:hypothetical protein
MWCMAVSFVTWSKHKGTKGRNMWYMPMTFIDMVTSSYIWSRHAKQFYRLMAFGYNMWEHGWDMLNMAMTS